MLSIVKQLLILGSSGHARVVIDIVEQAAEYTIVGLVDSYRPSGTVFCGYRVLGAPSNLRAIRDVVGPADIVIAVGDNWQRKRLWDEVREADPQLGMGVAIHPSARIGRDVAIGPGTVVMAGVVVNSGSEIAAGCILNTRSSLDHDCRMGEFSSLAPGVTTGGNVNVGPFAAISLGADIIHGVSVGEHTVVGAGSTVLRDLPSFAVAHGTPARVIRQRAPGDRYL